MRFEQYPLGWWLSDVEISVYVQWKHIHKHAESHPKLETSHDATSDGSGTDFGTKDWNR